MRLERHFSSAPFRDSVGVTDRERVGIMRKLLALAALVLATAAATASSAAPSGYTLSPSLQAVLQSNIESCAANAMCAQVLAGALNACALNAVCEPALVAFFIANPSVWATVATKGDRKSISVAMGVLLQDPTLLATAPPGGGRGGDV